jgi:glucose/arabinose dehydrogenase
MLAAMAGASCAGSNPPSPSASGQNPPVASGRIAWSQSAPAAAALQNYDFVLFIDGARTSLSGSTCTAAERDYECSAPLPQLTSGRHVVELSTVDRVTRLESPRSEPLAVGESAAIASQGGQASIGVRPTAPDTARDAANADGAHRPRLACVDRLSSTCFVISVIADDVGPVERLVMLPDGRLLASYGSGIVRVLPGGTPQRLDVNRSHAAADVADIAIDPDFLSNRFVYLATVTSTGADGRIAVDIVRMRELAGGFGEAATLAAELPAARGRPAISMGPDRRLYIALPSGTGRSASPYDGLVLRLTRDGAAAGSDRVNSPVLAAGTAQPSSFAWMDNNHFLLAGRGGRETAVRVVPMGPGAEWPAAAVPLLLPDAGALAAGVTQIVTSAGTNPLQLNAFLLAGDPPALFLARLTATPPTTALAMDTIPLGPWTPTTLAVTADGDLIVAASPAGDSRVGLLRLQVGQ